MRDIDRKTGKSRWELPPIPQALPKALPGRLSLPHRLGLRTMLEGASHAPLIDSAARGARGRPEFVGHEGSNFWGGFLEKDRFAASIHIEFRAREIGLEVRVPGPSPGGERI